MKALSDTQKTILQNAAERTDGNIEPLPTTINAGIRPRVIQGLLSRKLIEEKDVQFYINTEGLAAIGKETCKAKSEETGKKVNNENQTPQTADQQPEKQIKQKEQKNQKKPRPGSKLATMVALLTNENGASVAELADATQWQQHTVRGTLAGSLKKRFGYTISSSKGGDNIRRYRIINDD